MKIFAIALLLQAAVATGGSTSARYLPDLVIGAPGLGPGQFHIPYMVATCTDGSILVTDSARVQKFDRTGHFLWAFHDPAFTGGGQGVAVARDGSFWLSDYLGRRLFHCRPGGGIVETVATDAMPGYGVIQPYALAFGPRGVLYMTDYRDEYAGNAGRVFTYDPRTRHWTLFWTSTHTLHGIDVSRDGSRIAVAEAGDDRVMVLNSAGSPIDSTTPNANRIQYPEGVVLAGGGDFYVVDPAVHVSVQHYDPHGQFIDLFGSGNGSAIDQFHEPMGLALDRSRHFFVVDSANNRVVRWRMLRPERRDD